MHACAARLFLSQSARAIGNALRHHSTVKPARFNTIIALASEVGNTSPSAADDAGHDASPRQKRTVRKATHVAGVDIPTKPKKARKRVAAAKDAEKERFREAYKLAFGKAAGNTTIREIFLVAEGERRSPADIEEIIGDIPVIVDALGKDAAGALFVKAPQLVAELVPEDLVAAKKLLDDAIGKEACQKLLQAYPAVLGWGSEGDDGVAGPAAAMAMVQKKLGLTQEELLERIMYWQGPQLDQASEVIRRAEELAALLGTTVDGLKGRPLKWLLGSVDVEQAKKRLEEMKDLYEADDNFVHEMCLHKPTLLKVGDFSLQEKKYEELKKAVSAPACKAWEEEVDGWTPEQLATVMKKGEESMKLRMAAVAEKGEVDHLRLYTLLCWSDDKWQMWLDRHE